MNARDNALPTVNSTMKITGLWQVSPVPLLLKRLTFLPIAISKLEMISDTNYNHLTSDTLDALIQIDYMKQCH